MNGFDRQAEGTQAEETTIDAENFAREPAPGWSSSQWTLRSSFVAPQGIRSGWSMLIFIVIVVLEVLGTRVPVNHLPHSMKHNPTLEAWSPAVAAGILALLVLAATAVWASKTLKTTGTIRKRSATRTASRVGFPSLRG
jgi:hypothetical protein